MTEPREPRERIEALRRRDPDTLEEVARENLPTLPRAARAAGLYSEDGEAR